MFDLLVLFFCSLGIMAGGMVILEALWEGFRGIVKDFRGE